ncbi:MAG: hypothetical protein NUW14_12545 [Deltaproteobacteria bacterium]|nr:hypothetical protein [Deltaproteobacteria bacterium]
MLRTQTNSRLNPAMISATDNALTIPGEGMGLRSKNEPVIPPARAATARIGT